MIEAFGNFLLKDILFSNVFQAIAVILVGLIAAKVAGKIFEFSLKKQQIARNTLNSVVKSIELFVFVLSLILALTVLRVSVAEVLVSKVMAFIPSVIIFFLVFVLGYILVTLIVDALSYLFIRFGSDSYLEEFGISKQIISSFFILVKFFLLLIILMLSFSAVGVDIGLFGNFFSTLITAFIVLAVALFFLDSRKSSRTFFQVFTFKGI
jgi:hypothetical protein